MTTFHFRLQRVLDFRNMQFQIAESECQRAAAKLHAIRAQQVALASQKLQTRKLFSGLAEVEGRDLASLPGWYQWTERASGYLARQERTAEQELQKRRDLLIEAQRKVRLLEKLRDNRHTEWQSDFDREIEEQAADAYRGAHSIPR